MPGIFLKAKGAISKGLNAAKNAKAAQEIKDKIAGEEASSKVATMPLKILIGISSLGCAIVTFFVVAFVLVIAYVLVNAFWWLGGGGSSSAGSMSFSDADELYFNQGDGPWADVIYDAGGGTIASSGCGLVSITQCIDILTGNSYTPDEINEQLKEYYGGRTSEYAPGGSVVAKLVEFAVSEYNLTSAHYTNVDEAIADMASGNKVIICSDNGDGAHFIDPAGGKYSANHVIMAYKTDGENVWVKDSGRAGGNSVKYTKEEFSKIDFVGWYVLGTS